MRLSTVVQAKRLGHVSKAQAMQSSRKVLQQMLLQRAEHAARARLEHSAALTIQQAYRSRRARAAMGRFGDIVFHQLDRIRKQREAVPETLAFDPYEQLLSSRVLRCEVQAMERDMLLKRCTDDLVNDPELVSTVLLTYQNFMSDASLLAFMQLRFDSTPAPMREALKAELLSSGAPVDAAQMDVILDAWLHYSPAKRRAVQLCVLRFLRQWFDLLPYVFVDSRTLLGSLRGLLRRIVASEPGVYLTEVQDSAEALLQAVALGEATATAEAKARADMLANPADATGRRASVSGTRDRSASLAGPGAAAGTSDWLPSILPMADTIGSVMDLNPTEVARQLTLADCEAFRRILPTEFLKQRWCKKNAALLARNLISMIERFNEVVAWAATEVLRGDTFESRAETICRLIDVAIAARTLDNYNCLMAILTALESAPVARLSFTFELLPVEYEERFQDLRETMAMASNYFNYRKALKAAGAPCVPYLGVMMQDLTFIDDGNPDLIDGRLVNVDKHRMTANVIRQLQQFQSGTLLVQPVLVIEQYLAQDAPKWDPERQYQTSLALEPRALKTTRKAGARKIRYVDATASQEQLATLKQHVELPHAFVSRMLTRLREHSFAAKSYIVRRGDAGTSMFFVTRGNVEVLLPSGVAIPLNQGEFFGEISLFTGAPRGADVRARTPVHVLELTQELCAEMLSHYPELKDQFQEIARARQDMNAAIDKSGGKKPGKGGSNAVPRWITQLATAGQ